jgi:polyisoprenoid-binding protein YceI
VRILVGRAGLFAFAGHDHEIVAPAIRGQVNLDRNDVSRSIIILEFGAGALQVSGVGEPAEDVPEVQRVMLSDRVLDVERFPTIAFRSRRITLAQQSADRLELRVTGELTLHGVTQPLTIPVTVALGTDRLTAQGKATVRQTSFAIRPVTAGAGTVRVKDEVEVIFSISARRP